MKMLSMILGVDSIDVLTLMFELNEIGIDLPLTIFNETPRIS